MKKITLLLACLLTNLAMARSETDVSETPVNVQKFALENIDIIEIRYTSESVTLLRSNTDSLVVKEYMNSDDTIHHAQITHSDNTLIVEPGRRGLFDRRLRPRVEVYIPASDKTFRIQTTSGTIENINGITVGAITMHSSSGAIHADNLTANNVGFEAMSGRIEASRITADGVGFRTTSGAIQGENLTGNVSARTNNGRVVLNGIGGHLSVETTSGAVQHTVAKEAGNVSISTTSGAIVLHVPKELRFSFTSKTTSGRLATPFAEQLFVSVDDMGAAHGFIGGCPSETQCSREMNVETTSGPITVGWVD